MNTYQLIYLIVYLTLKHKVHKEKLILFFQLLLMKIVGIDYKLTMSEIKILILFFAFFASPRLCVRKTKNIAQKLFIKTL